MGAGGLASHALAGDQRIGQGGGAAGLVALERGALGAPARQSEEGSVCGGCWAVMAKGEGHRNSGIGGGWSLQPTGRRFNNSLPGGGVALDAALAAVLLGGRGGGAWSPCASGVLNRAHPDRRGGREGVADPGTQKDVGRRPGVVMAVVHGEGDHVGWGGRGILRQRGRRDGGSCRRAGRWWRSGVGDEEDLPRQSAPPPNIEAAGSTPLAAARVFGWGRPPPRKNSPSTNSSTKTFIMLWFNARRTGLNRPG